jgi:oxygen-dependent protoporphyrinogen oxidase
MADPKKIKRVIVVGGGVAGLSTAYLIREMEKDSDIRTELTILESKPEPGGSTRTDIIDGFTCEWGPNGFLDNEPATLELVKMLGIENRLVRADEASAKRYIYYGGKMREVALSPLKFLQSNILPLSSKLRMGMEFFIPAGKNSSDETVASFGRRRLGGRFTQYLLDPMVSGIFAGNIDELSLKAVFPKMYSMEQDYGGLFKALIAKKRDEKKTGVKSGGPAGPGATLYTFKGGMGELTDILASLLKPFLKLSTTVDSAEYRDKRFIIKAKNQTFSAEALILACPSYEAAKIIGSIDNRAAGKLNEIQFAPVDVVCQGYGAGDIEHDVSGFGVLIPRSVGMRSLGCLWSDSIFPGQAPKGYHLLRTIIGGAHDPYVVDLTNELLNEIAHDDMKTLLGIREKPKFKRIYRHPRGIAQYNVGHLQRVAAGEELEKNIPGLYFTGASYRGVSVNGCVKDAFKVAGDFWEMVRQTA